MRQRAIHFNGQTQAGCLIFHRETSERLTGRRHIMHKIPTPHRVLCLRAGLERCARPDLLPQLPLGYLQATRTPDPVYALEIHPPTTSLEKAFREPIASLGIVLGHPTQGLSQPRIPFGSLGRIPYPWPSRAAEPARSPCPQPTRTGGLSRLSLCPWAHHFFAWSSFITSTSKSRSAKTFLSRAFSWRSWRNSRTSSATLPEKCLKRVSLFSLL